MWSEKNYCWTHMVKYVVLVQYIKSRARNLLHLHFYSFALVCCLFYQNFDLWNIHIESNGTIFILHFKVMLCFTIIFYHFLVHYGHFYSCFYRCFHFSYWKLNFIILHSVLISLSILAYVLYFYLFSWCTTIIW